MATGLTSFSDPGSIGALYPFVGSEVILTIVGVILWLAFHYLGTKEESREWEEADQLFNADLLLPGADEPGHRESTHTMHPGQLQPPSSSGR